MRAPDTDRTDSEAQPSRCSAVRKRPLVGVSITVVGIRVPRRQRRQALVPAPVGTSSCVRPSGSAAVSERDRPGNRCSLASRITTWPLPAQKQVARQRGLPGGMRIAIWGDDFMPQNEEIRNRIYELFQASMHPNAVAHELHLDPSVVFAAFVSWRSGK